MNDPRLDAGTAERLLRGERTGPPGLAELLAAAARPAADDLGGEEAAVIAFRATRACPVRRLPALISLKAALIGFLLLLAGGVTAMAATSQHLPGPLGHQHAPISRTPKTPRAAVPRTPTPSPLPPDRHGKHPKRTTPPKKHPHPTKNPPSNEGQGDRHRSTQAARGAPAERPGK